MPDLQPDWTFIGFSTLEKDNVLYDLDLAKRDLKNILMTPKGSLDWDPERGSIIPRLLFELKNTAQIRAIEDDVQDIVEQDARIRLEDVNVIDIPNGYRIVIDIVYLDGQQRDRLELDFLENQFGDIE